MLFEECPLRTHNRNVIATTKAIAQAKEIGEEKHKEEKTKQTPFFTKGEKQMQ